MLTFVSGIFQTLEYSTTSVGSLLNIWMTGLYTRCTVTLGVWGLSPPDLFAPTFLGISSSSVALHTFILQFLYLQPLSFSPDRLNFYIQLLTPILSIDFLISV